jgi:hypothetical protein
MVEQLISTIGVCELHAAAITDARRRQAKRAKPAPVTITVDEMMLILRQQGFVCALSGLPFWDEIAAYGPSIPSIDRVDAWLGYVSGNVRVIRLGVNGLGAPVQMRMCTGRRKPCWRIADALRPSRHGPPGALSLRPDMSALRAAVRIQGQVQGGGGQIGASTVTLWVGK